MSDVFAAIVHPAGAPFAVDESIQFVMAAGATRVLWLGGAGGRMAAKRAQQSMHASEVEFFAHAAKHLLREDTTTADTPKAPELGDALDRMSVVVAAGNFAPLPVVRRAVELLEGHVVVFADAPPTADDEGSARLWVCPGGAAQAEMQTSSVLVRVPRALWLRADHDPGSARIAWLDEHGAVREEVVPLRAHNRISVMGAT
jgi:hypothetical protein